MLSKTKRLILWKTNKLESFYKAHQPLTTGLDYLKLVNDPKQIMKKNFFSSKSTNNNDNKKQEERNKHENWNKSVNMISLKENICKLITQSLMISNLEQSKRLGRILGSSSATRKKVDDAEPRDWGMEQNFVPWDFCIKSERNCKSWEKFMWSLSPFSTGLLTNLADFLRNVNISILHCCIHFNKALI